MMISSPYQPSFCQVRQRIAIQLLLFFSNDYKDWDFFGGEQSLKLELGEKALLNWQRREEGNQGIFLNDFLIFAPFQTFTSLQTGATNYLQS